MVPALNRIIIYTKKMPDMIRFYSEFFGYEAVTRENDRIVELRSPAAGLTLLLHPAGKGQKEGQALVKLVFDVEDVDGFHAELNYRGLEVGPVHEADGYKFANIKDPSNNTVSISSRAFAGAGE